MKTLFKILTPTISTIGIASISLTSCGTTSADGYTAIPTNMLNIIQDGKVLDGFVDPTLEIKNYNKITVPKNVESVSLIYKDKHVSFDAIKKIDYESNSNWTTITSIANLNNLEYLVLPPKLSNVGFHVVFGCTKLSTLDISNVEKLDYLINTNWIDLNGTIYDSGTLIVKKEQASKVEAIKTKNPCLKNFKTKEK